jgi:hypothetical protein
MSGSDWRVAVLVIGLVAAATFGASAPAAPTPPAAPAPEPAAPAPEAAPEPAASAPEAAPEPAAPAPEAAPPAAPVAAPAAPPAAGSDAQFFSELGYKDTATAADAARAMTILVSEGRQGGGDFIADKQYLRDEGITSGWLEAATADKPLDKGHLAALVCRALKIKGGLWMRLFGPLPRCALRECIYLDLMVGGAEYEHVTGGELVGVIDRADRFRLKQAGHATPELQGQPGGAEEAK